MDVRSVQDSGTMPLIAEIVLAVSVGCVEIRNSNQEGFEMDSYQVSQYLQSFCTLASKPEVSNMVVNPPVGTRPGTLTEAVAGGFDQEAGIPGPAPPKPCEQSR